MRTDGVLSSGRRIVRWGAPFRNNETPLTDRIHNNKITFKFTCVTNTNFYKSYFYLLLCDVIESEASLNKKEALPPGPSCSSFARMTLHERCY